MQQKGRTEEIVDPDYISWHYSATKQDNQWG